MLEFEAMYQVNTPCFVGGAHIIEHSERTPRTEMRLPSFKGLLRFWWRALAWARVGQEGGPSDRLEKIQSEENVLFGSTETGQAAVRMRLVFDPKIKNHEEGDFLGITDKSGRPRRPIGPGARYLAYGLVEAFGKNKGKLQRGCLPASFEFVVYLRAKELSDESRELLIDAMRAIGLFGGIGARSRKGYGSLQLKRLTCGKTELYNGAKPSRQDLADDIQAFYGRYRNAEPGQYSTLSSSSRIVIAYHLLERRSLGLLDYVGRELVRFRSKGYKPGSSNQHFVLQNVKSEYNFNCDHQLMIDATNGKGATSHPKRVIFGLPHAYDKKKVVAPSDKELDRRASPLFIHIHECSEGPVATLLLLQSQFLPGSQPRLDITVDKEEYISVPLAKESDLYKPMHDFLDRICDREKCKEKLEGKKLV